MDEFKVGWYLDKENRPHKVLRSENYNYDFRYTDGLFVRFGKTIEEDPKRSPFGAEILDFEVVKGCLGVGGDSSTGGDGGRLCPECYKSNDKKCIKYTDLETFRRCFEKVNINKTITQVALGLDSGAILNPDLWKICEYLRSVRVVPNGTVADISEETAEKINALWGSVAVSLHQYDKSSNGWEAFYRSIGNLSLGFGSGTLKQINCHIVSCEETYETILELFHRKKTDPWLKNLNAIVLLGLKQCGRGKTGFTRLSDEHFETVINTALDYDIGLGLDSCSGNRFTEVIRNRPDFKKLEQLIEPCESFALFSAYLNEDGKYYPCSFAESCFEGIDVQSVGNFIDDVWNSEQMIKLGEQSLANKRSCIYYDV
jgi:hypothetical protein